MSRAKKTGRAPVDKTTGRPLAIDKRDSVRYFSEKSRKEAKDRLKRARAAVHDAHREGKERLKAVQEMCRENIEAAEREYASAREKVSSARTGKKDARSKCTGNKRATREETKGRVAAAKEKRDEEAREHRRDRVWEGFGRARGGRRISATKKQKEEREESDDFVVQNLSPELLPLWNLEKERFKGPPHRRYEQFLEYVEENPEFVLIAREKAAGISLERDLEREFAEEQARHYGFSLEAQSSPRSRGPRKKSAAERTRAMFEPNVMLQRGRHSPGLAPPPPLRLSLSPNDEEEARPRGVESGQLPF